MAASSSAGNEGRRKESFERPAGWDGRLLGRELGLPSSLNYKERVMLAKHPLLKVELGR
jgi:hypothetical protein